MQYITNISNQYSKQSGAFDVRVTDSWSLLAYQREHVYACFLTQQEVRIKYNQYIKSGYLSKYTNYSKYCLKRVYRTVSDEGSDVVNHAINNLGVIDHENLKLIVGINLDNATDQHQVRSP